MNERSERRPSTPDTSPHDGEPEPEPSQVIATRSGFELGRAVSAREWCETRDILGHRAHSYGWNHSALWIELQVLLSPKPIAVDVQPDAIWFTLCERTRQLPLGLPSPKSLIEGSDLHGACLLGSHDARKWRLIRELATLGDLESSEHLLRHSLNEGHSTQGGAVAFGAGCRRLARLSNPDLRPYLSWPEMAGPEAADDLFEAAFVYNVDPLRHAEDVLWEAYGCSAAAGRGFVINTLAAVLADRGKLEEAADLALAYFRQNPNPSTANVLKRLAYELDCWHLHRHLARHRSEYDL